MYNQFREDFLKSILRFGIQINKDLLCIVRFMDDKISKKKKLFEYINNVN